MDAYLELWAGAGPQLIPLTGDRITLGSAASNDLAVPTDRRMSRLHAVLERFPTGWCLRDLGSSNGTFRNGERIWHEVALRDGDEIRAGTARLVYRAGSTAAAPAHDTETGEPPPELTPRERDVLVRLCRPLLTGDLFTEPASSREIATALTVTEAAVKQHLLRLYEKFGITGDGERRRLRLANEVMRRGAVTIADL
jgi:pSer/pThr/pTyr-binding forkhead associated (FHA) protein